MPNLIEIKREKDVLYVYWTITDFCNFRLKKITSPLDQ